MPNPKIMRIIEAVLPVQYCSEFVEDESYIKESKESDTKNNEE